MKFFLSLLLCCVVHTAPAQIKEYRAKDSNKTRQIEQLQQLRETVSRKADSLQAQLPPLASSLENTRKKIDQLKKDSNTRFKPEHRAKDQSPNNAYELIAITNQEDSLRRKFDMRLNTLDQTRMLQKDLEEKINALIKESNR